VVRTLQLPLLTHPNASHRRPCLHDPHPHPPASLSLMRLRPSYVLRHQRFLEYADPPLRAVFLAIAPLDERHVSYAEAVRLRSVAVLHQEHCRWHVATTRPRRHRRSVRRSCVRSEVLISVTAPEYQQALAPRRRLSVTAGSSGAPRTTRRSKSKQPAGSYRPFQLHPHSSPTRLQLTLKPLGIWVCTHPF
jgi:hypothetical protein